MASERHALPPLRLVVVLLVALACLPSGAHAAAGPEFLDQDRLSIPVERLPHGRWQVTVINPGPPIDAEVRVAGAIADALSVRGGRFRLAGGGAATVTLVAGARRHTGTGQLVLISAAGTDRLPVAITPPPSLLRRYPFLPVLGGVLLLAAIAAVTGWRRRAPSPPEPAPTARPRRPGPAGTHGFTHSDEPARADGLNRTAYARHLALLARHATPPMVIGVFGEWGTGKTSMLMQVRDQLREAPECAHVWFDPWRHQYDDNPVLPLLHVIVSDLGLEGRENVGRTLRTISEVLGSLVLSASLKISVADVRRSVEDYDAEHFRIRSERTRLDEHLGALIDQALAACGKERLVVFVDDLDRCHADRITALLEALKLHFNRHNCVFVLGVAKGPLIAAVRETYQDPVGDYLDKIIQFPFEMPRLSDKDFADYLDSLLTPEIRAAGAMLRCGLRRNPRAVKRFVNVLILQDRVARDRRLDPYDVSALAAVLLLRDGAPGLYAELMKETSLLRRIAAGEHTGMDQPAAEWELAVSVVRELRRTPAGLPPDVVSYIDLVRESPVPQSSDLLDEEPRDRYGDTLGEALDRLAPLVREQVDRLVGEEGDLLQPVVRFRGEPSAQVAELDEILARAGGTLMITGRPGTGKTVLAARLARRAVERRTGRVPVFLRLGVAAAEFSGDHRWITHALVAEYGLSLADAHTMVRRESLLLVLDGLEEVAPARRGELLERVMGTRFGVIVAGRDLPAPGPGTAGTAEVIEVIGVPAAAARSRLETLLARHGVEADRILGLTSELMSSPQLYSVLTGSPDWIAELPEGRIDDFPGWYAARAVRKAAGAGFDREAVARALGGIAAGMRSSGRDTFSGRDAGVRAALWREGIPGARAVAVLRLLARAGLLREAPPECFHFAHPLLLERVARHGGGRRAQEDS